MVVPSPTEVSRLLVDWGNGDQAALDELIPLVYDELRRLAGRYMRRESQGHTLQTSALVNEAYLRLVDQKGAPLLFLVSAPLLVCYVNSGWRADSTG